MSLSCFLIVWVAITSGVSAAVVSPGLLNNDWATLERDVTLRYFSFKNFQPSSDQNKIWDKMGENITCTVNNQGKASVSPPSSFEASRPIKLFMHGFSVTGRDYTTNLLPAWMERYKGEASVILLDWQPLASAFQWRNFSDFVYDDAAYNGIDVGDYAGRCLAELCNMYGLEAEQLHLVGHSLGGQSVGKMGRSFQAAHLGGEKVKRITGLDPAGPRFETNGYEAALFDLKKNILTAESAQFVDVIHTNGGFKPSVLHAFFHWESPRLGYLQQLGHIDFYPDGGSHQTGCPPTLRSLFDGESCSHSRAIMYYYYSINEKTLFPSKPCQSVVECNEKVELSGQDLAYMGEDADQYKGGKRLFYTDVKDCNWSYKEHNNVDCIKVQELTDSEIQEIKEIWADESNQQLGRQGQLEQVPEVQSAKQILNSNAAKYSTCNSMHKAFMAVTRARMGLDCGSGNEHSENFGNLDDHRVVVEAVQSCLGSEDDHLCLMRSLASLGDGKCSSLRRVENGMKSLGIFCPGDNTEVGVSGSCGFWQKAECTARVLAAEHACIVPIVADIKPCVESILGIGSDCIPCICSIIGC